MEITGPERLNVSSSITVKIAGIQKLESVTLAKEAVGAKLAGCAACQIGTLLARVRPNLGNGVSGVFTASDGATTEPIALCDLGTGWLVHSTSTAAELPSALGGPLRVVFPEGSRVTSICGKPTPLTLKGVMRLDLHSEFELKDAKLNQEVSTRAPSIMAEMEQEHSATLLALARIHGGVEHPASVMLAALDARGLTLRVTDKLTGAVSDQVLAPFPRPLESMQDVATMFQQMHQEAFASLPFAFKVHARYYTEPTAVAARRAYKSSSAAVSQRPAVAAATVALVAVGAALLLRRRASSK